MAGNFRRGASRTNLDARLRFEPLSVIQAPMPTLNRPMFLPQVLGAQRAIITTQSSQQNLPSHHQSLQPMVIAPSQRNDQQEASSDEDDGVDLTN